MDASSCALREGDASSQVRVSAEARDLLRASQEIGEHSICEAPADVCPKARGKSDEDSLYHYAKTRFSEANLDAADRDEACKHLKDGLKSILEYYKAGVPQKSGLSPNKIYGAALEFEDNCRPSGMSTGQSVLFGAMEPSR
jgi:hypothetical protein